MATIPTQHVSPSLPVSSAQGANVPSDQTFPQSGRHPVPGQQSPTFQDLLAKSQGPRPNNPLSAPDTASHSQHAQLPHTQSPQGAKPAGLSGAQLADQHLGSTDSLRSSTSAAMPNSATKIPKIDELAASELKMDVSRSLITQQASQSLASDTPSHFEQHQLSQQQSDQLQTSIQQSVADRHGEQGSNSKSQSSRSLPDQPHTSPSTPTTSSGANPASSSSTFPPSNTQSHLSQDATNISKTSTNDPSPSPASLVRASAGTTVSSGLHSGLASESTNPASTTSSRASTIDPTSASQSAGNQLTHKPNASPSPLQNLVSKKPQATHTLAQQESMASSLSKLSQSLAEALRSGGELSFRINPGTLGTVSVSLTPHSDNTLQAQSQISQSLPGSLFDLTLTASDPAAAQSLREQIESLRTSLQQKGIIIASVSIQSEQEAASFKQETLSGFEDTSQRSHTGHNSNSHNSDDQSNRHHASSQNQSSNRTLGRPIHATSNSHELGAPSGTSLASLMPLIRAGLARLDAVI